MSQPTRVSDQGDDADDQEPATEDEAEQSIATPSAPRNGRNDGPGMWTPGGGPCGRRPGARGVGRADVVVVDPQRLGEPVQQGQRRGR